MNDETQETIDQFYDADTQSMRGHRWRANALSAKGSEQTLH